MARTWKDIEIWKDIKDTDWNDWKWQVRNRITNVEELKKVINLTAKEEEDITAVIQNFRMGITPWVL